MSTGTRVSFNEKESIRESYDREMAAAEKKIIDKLMKSTGRSLSTIRRAVYYTLG